jgi:hypothetical protein
VFHLHIIDISKNATTGLILVEARIVETFDDGREIQGAIERSQIEALEIASKYDGDSDVWLLRVGHEMLQRHRLRTAAHTGVNKWKGQRMPLA